VEAALVFESLRDLLHPLSIVVRVTQECVEFFLAWQNHQKVTVFALSG
jgi:hypothetical protein